MIVILSAEKDLLLHVISKTKADSSLPRAGIRKKQIPRLHTPRDESRGNPFRSG